MPGTYYGYHKFVLPSGYGGFCLTKLVEATNGHSLVEAENAICYDIVRGYGLRRSLFWRRRVFFQVHAQFCWNLE